MEKKAELKQPYTESQRMNFIVENNHNKGYEIREVETTYEVEEQVPYTETETVEKTGYNLEAWGYSEEELQARERERINMLTMTALDFIGVLQQFGLTLEQINTYLEANLSVKMQLTYCQNVFCGVAKSLMPITFEDVTITADMVEIAFRIKNGEPIDEDNGTGEASDETSNEDETSSNPPVDNNEEIEE